MDKATPLAHMKPHEYRRVILEQAKETLRIAPTFHCMACRTWKDRPDAGGAFIWEPRPGPLAHLPMKGVPIYNLCRECTEKNPDVVYRSVAQGFIAAGLFGDEPTEEGKQLLGGT
jgi:hypothetical protein